MGTEWDTNLVGGPSLTSETLQLKDTSLNLRAQVLS
jgi:hypothetical protein